MLPVAVRQAEPSELPLVIEILDDAARWLLDQGIRQWESPPPPDCLEEFRAAVVRGHVYLMTAASGEVVGAFRVTWNGSPLWPDEPEAGYLYSLALRPRFIGQGIGRAGIDWLTRYFTSLGRRKFRLDCISTNTRLRKWYEELGFVYRGEVASGPLVLALYELDLPDPAP